GCGNGARVEPVRHRQTKGAATDMFGLPPLRHTPTLPSVRIQQPLRDVSKCADDRDRGTHRGATPPTPPGIRVTYHGGSTGLGLVRNMKSREAERVEVVVAQCLLNRRVSGHAPKPRRRTGGDRGSEL